MKTLYDLLEALPDDDAEGLRAAFRKAAKANHPDFNPSDPEASERFRRIVRANAILSAAVAAVLVGGYLAFKPVDGRSIAQANEAPGLEPMQASATAEISV